MERDKTPEEMAEPLQRACDAAIILLLHRGFSKFSITLVLHVPSVEPPPAQHSTDTPYQHYTQPAAPASAPDMLRIANYVSKRIIETCGVRYGAHLEN